MQTAVNMYNESKTVLSNEIIHGPSLNGIARSPVPSMKISRRRTKKKSKPLFKEARLVISAWVRPVLNFAEVRFGHDRLLEKPMGSVQVFRSDRLLNGVKRKT